jgi:hypothetical protein
LYLSRFLVLAVSVVTDAWAVGVLGTLALATRADKSFAATGVSFLAEVPMCAFEGKATTHSQFLANDKFRVALRERSYLGQSLRLRHALCAAIFRPRAPRRTRRSNWCRARDAIPRASGGERLADHDTALKY